MPDLIFSLFSKRILRNLEASYYRPRSLKDLKFAFPMDGMQVFAFHDLGQLSTARFNNIQSLLRMADAGMDRQTRKDIGEMILKANERLIRAKSQNERSLIHAEFSVIATELLIEGANIIPEHVYYDMAATCCVREDENPEVMDQTIHLQKFQFLKDAGMRGASFFLHMPLFTQLLQQSLTSEQGLIELLPIWNRERKRRETIREVFAQRHEQQRRTSHSSSEGSGATIKPSTKPS